MTGLNRAAELLVDAPREQLLGSDLWARFPRSREEGFGPHCAEARRTGRSAVFEAWGTTVGRWLSVHVVPSGSATAAPCWWWAT